MSNRFGDAPSIPKPIYVIHCNGKRFRFRELHEVRAFLRSWGDHLLVRVVFPDLLRKFRPRETKEQMIQRLATESPSRSKHSIAKEVGCSDHLVAKTLRENGFADRRVVVGDNGKTYTVTDELLALKKSKKLKTSVKKTATAVHERAVYGPLEGAETVTERVEDLRDGVREWIGR